MTMLRLLPVLTVAAAISLSGGGAARAQVEVTGRPEAVHIEAHGASIQEVMAALHDRFNLRYRSNVMLEAEKTGVFDGPLSRVAARILDGYDYAMTVTPQGIDVLVLRQQQSGATFVAVTPAHAARPPLTAAERRHYEHGHLR